MKLSVIYWDNGHRSAGAANSAVMKKRSAPLECKLPCLLGTRSAHRNCSPKGSRLYFELAAELGKWCVSVSHVILVLKTQRVHVEQLRLDPLQQCWNPCRETLKGHMRYLLNRCGIAPSWACKCVCCEQQNWGGETWYPSPVEPRRSWVSSRCQTVSYGSLFTLLIWGMGVALASLFQCPGFFPLE